VDRKLHTSKNDSDNDTCSDVVIFDSDYDTRSDLYKSKLMIGESSNFLFKKGDKAGKRLANEFMHFKINDQSVYQILRGVEREVLESVASDLRFAYFTFGNNARYIAKKYGVEVLQHFHHQQVLIDRKCHGGNVLTFADDKANLQNTAKMLKVVDAGNSALREYTVQELWNKVHDVEFSKTDGLEMAQEAKFTNKFIREVTDEQRKQRSENTSASLIDYFAEKTDEQRKQSNEQRIATLNGRTDEAKKQSSEQRIATLNITLNGRTDEAKKQSEEQGSATLTGRTHEQRKQSEEQRIATLNGRTDEVKKQTKQRQREAHARRPDEQKSLQQQRHYNKESSENAD
jgi:hypothetical protein